MRGRDLGGSPAARPGSRRPRLRSVAGALGAAALLGTGCRAHEAPAPTRLRVAVPYELDTLDPHAKNTVSNFAVAAHMYEALVTTDAHMKIGPGLARLWENPDPLTWVFRLRPGVRFHSGRPLRAADVAYSIRRLLDAGPGLEMSGYVYGVEEVSALDPLTVRIRTRRPMSVLLNKLRFVCIVPDGAAAELATQPDGTGPYRLARWSRPNSVSLIAHDGYWGERVPIREVELLLGRAPEQAAAELRSGGVQLAQCSSRRAARELEGAAGIRVARRPSLFLKYLAYDLFRDRTPHMQTRTNPFLDPRVRESLDAAIDRQELVERLSVEATPANQPVPPFIFGFNPSLPMPMPDPARANRLLSEAGYPDGFRGVLHARRIVGEAAAVVTEMLGRVGVDLELRVLGDNEFVARSRARDMSLFVTRSGAPTGDASDVLDTGFHSVDPADHLGLGNYGGYSDPELDAAIERSSAVETLDRRRSALESIIASVVAERVWLPLYYDQDVYGVAESIAWEPRSDSFVLAFEARAATGAPRLPYGR